MISLSAASTAPAVTTWPLRWRAVTAFPLYGQELIAEAVKNAGIDLKGSTVEYYDEAGGLFEKEGTGCSIPRPCVPGDGCAAHRLRQRRGETPLRATPVFSAASWILCPSAIVRIGVTGWTM